MGQRHKQADEVALAVGLGLAEQGLGLVADGAQTDAAVAGDLGAGELVEAEEKTRMSSGNERTASGSVTSDAEVARIR